MVLITLVTGAFVNQLTSLRGLTLWNLMFPEIFPTRQDHWDPQGLSDRRACLAIILADVRLRLWGSRA